MSRTRKGAKAMGYDFWSRRPCSGSGFGRWVKHRTARMERIEDKRLCEEQE